MRSYERSQVDTLCRRLAEEPRRLIALFGPRQTGKTTIVNQALRRIDFKSRYLAVDRPNPTGLTIPSDSAETIYMAPQARDTEWLVRNWEEARLRSPTIRQIHLGF